MNCHVKQQIEFSSLFSRTPSLEAAVKDWYTARHRYQCEPLKEHRHSYNAATDELGQSIAAWQADEPGLAEQFGLWFLSHQDVWSADGADAASSL
jgi:hypothetical protein